LAFDGFLFFPDKAGTVKDMSGETIFIVDDDEAVRDSLKLLLESHGCQVEDYGSTRDFFRAYRKGARQCVVLDHHLPGETGIEFLESDDGAALRLPVILVTGGGDQALKARATKAGALAYFDKPINDSELVATIFRLLDAPSAVPG
jgi:FixJ family two-component response regulator